MKNRPLELVSRTIKKAVSRLPTRLHITVGLCSVLTSVLLIAVLLGFVPDRQGAVIQGQIALSEALASSSSTLLGRNQLGDTQQILEFAVERNPSLLAVELQRLASESVRQFGVPDQGAPSIVIPVYRLSQRWGELRFFFDDGRNVSSLSKMHGSIAGLVLFITLLGFPVFHFYLGRMLKELNPSTAVPSRVRSALDTIAEALIVIDQQGDIVLANAAFAELTGRAAQSLIGVPARTLPWETV